MVGSRWFRRAGPGIAALGAIALIASTTLGAPGRSWAPVPCGGVARVGVPSTGTWYRLDPVLQAGARAGQRLALGHPGSRDTRAVELDSESFAAGPFSGTVLVGSDDGTHSRLSLIDVARGCAWSVGGSDDVVRTATLAPDGATLYEFRVDRRTRADLGVWRRPLDGSTPAALFVPAIEPDDRFGRTWMTDLGWTEDGRSLAVQSCGEVACRVRIVDPATGRVRLVAEPTLGDLVGISGDRLIAHGACRGLPCPLLSIDLAGGSTTVLDEHAGQAVLSRNADGRAVVVHEVGATGDVLRMIGLDGSDPQVVAGDRDGRRLVAGAPRAASAAEHQPDWILFATDGRLPIDGSQRPILRRVPDGRTVPLDEVSR
ncbi:MAG TPA: hypothetical protein VM408_02040 [Methylomirabilota bacterium]|nr:hypothetical protein [Methylomirabilota bacterium]